MNQKPLFTIYRLYLRLITDTPFAKIVQIAEILLVFRLLQHFDVDPFQSCQ